MAAVLLAGIIITFSFECDENISVTGFYINYVYTPLERNMENYDEYPGDSLISFPNQRTEV